LDHLARFDHPSIVKLIEVFEDDQNVYLVTEALKGDNIIENLWKQGSIHEGMAASVLQQVLAGVRYMHGKSVAHNQLNPTNIHHLNSGPLSTVKIIDSDQLGADIQIKDMEKFLGSSKVDNACFVAPELIRGDWHIKNDIWSAGVLMFTMLTGNPPFWGENQKEVFKLITTYKFDMTHVRWQAISDEGRDLILKMMAHHPKDRLDATDALMHPWFQRALRGDYDHMTLEDAMQSLKTFHAGSRLKQAMHTFFIKNLLTDNEIHTLEQQFKGFDKNGNGKLSRDELIAGFREVKGIDFNEKEIDQLIKNVDLNGSGDIDYQEFIRGAITREKMLTDERLEQAFYMFDINGDNLISYQEIRAVLDSTKEKVDTSLIDKALKDIGKSGKNANLTF
jgi:calcium-dependent protein kinase